VVARVDRRSSVRTPLAVRGVAAVGGEHLNTAGWTLHVRVPGRVAVRVDLENGTVPVDLGWWLCWRDGCRRAGGFNTGGIICGHATLVGFREHGRACCRTLRPFVDRYPVAL